MHRIILLMQNSFIDSAGGHPVTSDSWGPSTDDRDWFKETVLTLVDLVTAVALFIIGLASKRLRKRTASTFDCESSLPSFRYTF
jgi:hypothetical protein